MKMMIYGQFNITDDKEFWLITKVIDHEYTEDEMLDFLDTKTGFRDVFDNVMVKITDDTEQTIYSSVCF